MPLLVVGDDRGLLGTWERDLRTPGDQVWTATGFESAIAALMAITPRAAVVDTSLSLPEVARLLNLLQHCLVPVLVLVENEAARARWSKEAGRRDAVVAKPVESAALNRCLKRLVRSEL